MKKPTAVRLLTGLAVLAYAATWSSSCGSTDTVGVPGGSSGHGGAAGAGGNDITINLTGATPSSPAGSGGQPGTIAPQENCGATTVDSKRAEADVLIVLDRSSSMTSNIGDDSDCRGGSSCTTRLQAVVTGIQAVVSGNPGIRWGLELFTTPKKSLCTVSGLPQVDVGPDTASAIQSQLASITTASSTPTAAAIKVATDYLKTVHDGNNKVILLATDGVPNCADGTTDSDGMPGTLEAVRAASAAGFLVYVIGIGPEVGNLNELARTGGTNSYYPVSSTAELNAALSSIAKAVATTCTYKVAKAPPDKGLVFVYVDKKFVGEDDADGWTFDPSDATGATVTLTGAYCEDILSGAATQVQIIFGCPNVAPPVLIP
jgi:Mg-chelatase subunit ChlD